MNGAEALIESLVRSGVEVCFNNPGTSEMHLVAAIDKVKGMRPILGLFEGVVTGAADGYGRMAGKPACTLLHLGPGLGNGLANLHNAKKAGTPVVNVVGEHATYHRKYDAPLNSDIRSLAGPMSHWVETIEHAGDAARMAARAVAEARRGPGRIATLILPADSAWNELAAPAPIAALEPAPSPEVTPAQIDAVAEALRKAKNAVILLGADGVRAEALAAAGRVAAASGARLYCETFNKRIERGAGRVAAKTVPYFAEMALDELQGTDLLVLAGARVPVAFFAYPGKASVLVPEGCEARELARADEDVTGALTALADALGAPARPNATQELKRPDLPASSDFNAGTIGQAIGALLPEGAIVADEGCTSGMWSQIFTAGAPPHDWLQLTGGSIGCGVPLATGAAVACPDRKVVCLQGDGGAMYTIQALWTQAREGLDVVTILFANRSYAILNIELGRVGVSAPGPKAKSMLDIGNPTIDFTAMAKAMGVNAVRCTDNAGFAKAFKAALAEKGPHLIEVVI
ncbi:MAG: acetolactate synthase large subunit [Alphaproteobacteria bacterium]|nr:acetolactate synthase large subunit [Alphaproteobacteria bacterium]